MLRSKSQHNHKYNKIAQLTEALLCLIGENPNREGLKDTPMRVAKMYGELFSSLTEKEPSIKLFKNEGYNEFVCETDIHYYSMCEHHLVPFFGVVHVGYIPDKSLVGLSKIARVVDYYAHKPQIQEKMTKDIAEYLFKQLKPVGLIVVCEGTHLCMAMRGIKKPRHNTITSFILPDPKKFPKEEFFDILKIRRHEAR